MKKLLPSFLGLAWLCISSVLGAAEFPYEVRLQIIDPAFNSTDPRLRLTIYNKTNNSVAGRVLLAEKGFPFDSDTYELRTGDGKEIKVRPQAKTDTNRLQQIVLVPASRLDKDTDYSLDIKPGRLVFMVEEVETPNPALHADLSQESANIALKYADPRTAQRHISLLGGNVGGVASMRASSVNPRFLNVEWLNVDLNGEADITLSPKESTNFFNHIQGEVRAWFPINPTNAPLQHGEAFLHAKLVSDERFENIDSQFGAGLGWFVQDPISTFLARAFVTNSVIVKPLVIVGYDYVHELKQDAPKNIDSGENSSRLSALLRWQLPIARDLSFGNLPGLGDKFDVDVDFELKGSYDFGASRFIDQSWVTLALSPKTKGSVKPSLTFTWARGQAAPNFDQINALLAGLTVRF